jgi:hypothetical protein
MNSLLLEIVKCYGDVEYAVTLITGDTDRDLYVEGVDKSHTFATEAEAQCCFEKLCYIKDLSPYAALKKFNRYKTRSIKLPLSKCVGHTKRIRHCVHRPDGTKSYWDAVLCGEVITLTDTQCFKSLRAFVEAHYLAEHPFRKGGNGWEECETILYGEWVKLGLVREVAV